MRQSNGIPMNPLWLSFALFATLLLFSLSGAAGPAADAPGPAVAQTHPPSGATGVRANLERAYFKFDKALQWPIGRSGQDKCWEISTDWGSCALVAWSDTEIVFERYPIWSLPALPPGAEITVKLNPPGSAAAYCFRDAAGNPLSPYEASFTIRQNANDPPSEPRVVATNPPNGASGVSPDIAAWSLTFSKPMAATKSLWGLGWPTKDYIWSTDQKTLTVTRDTANSTLYPGMRVAMVLNPVDLMGFKDIEGNALEEYTYLFTIGNDRWNSTQSTYGVGLHKIAADPARGFHWPYYLSIPKALARKSVLLVAPNNSGIPSRSDSWHDFRAREDLFWHVSLASTLKVPVLVPVFPRYWSGQNIQALQGMYLNPLAYYQPELPQNLQRIDRQLIAMIDDARQRINALGREIDSRVFITGFSASGGFANRFAIIHPDRVKAAACGGGGWMTVPLGAWNATELNFSHFESGIRGLEAFAGEPFDLETFVTVPHFIYVGDQDKTGVFDCSYIDAGVGGPIQYSWQCYPLLAQICGSVGARVQTKVYPGIGHWISDDALADLRAFFQQHLPRPEIAPELGILLLDE